MQGLGDRLADRQTRQQGVGVHPLKFLGGQLDLDLGIPKPRKETSPHGCAHNT
jgi:hypothetical protein